MEEIKKTLTSLSHEPGVYLYKNDEGTVIYVGKARDLSRRVKQYFTRRAGMDEKTKRLVADIRSIQTIATTSEFDALLLEAKLIREFMPKYNVISRDDKSPLYVVITLSETLPRLFLVRKGEIGTYSRNKQNAVYGPFQSGFAVRGLLRQLRSIVPYCTQKQRTGKPCFYTHLGLCQPCPSAIVSFSGAEQKEKTALYRKNMLRLKALFDGKVRWLADEYEKEMRRFAELQQFELASAVKQRLLLLNSLSQHRYDPQVFIEQGAADIYEEELAELHTYLCKFYPNLKPLTRIECFDISNLYGQQAVGSMVVLLSGRPESHEYRKFRIKTVRGISDVSMMDEVLSRRLKHREWPYPQFILIDGGKPQVAAARDVLRRSQLSIPMAGLAKREEEIVIPDGNDFVTLRLPLSGRAIKVLMRIRDEAHRFAITYHRLLRSKAFITS
ncbi:GIY-YIG nuclease family protein [Patescibacteria group bacterium]|nr:GIY-YIG nuclease family protein [Patescibacteria group bacterium]